MVQKADVEPKCKEKTMYRKSNQMRILTSGGLGKGNPDGPAYALSSYELLDVNGGHEQVRLIEGRVLRSGAMMVGIGFMVMRYEM